MCYAPSWFPVASILGQFWFPVGFLELRKTPVPSDVGQALSRLRFRRYLLDWISVDLQSVVMSSKVSSLLHSGHSALPSPRNAIPKILQPVDAVQEVSHLSCGVLVAHALL